MRPVSRAATALAIAVLAVGCGDDDEGPAPPPPTEATPNQAEPKPHEDTGRRDEPADGEAAGIEAAAVERVLRSYVRALDDRDGERVCALLAPGAIDAVELPRQRGGCGPSLSASIGYRDPRGLPVFESARIAEVVSIDAETEAARAVVTVVTEFADRREPSIEDDVIYLERAGDRWLVAKPSAVLYRAVGIADIPPSVLAPP